MKKKYYIPTSQSIILTTSVMKWSGAGSTPNPEMAPPRRTDVF